MNGSVRSPGERTRTERSGNNDYYSSETHGFCIHRPVNPYVRAYTTTATARASVVNRGTRLRFSYELHLCLLFFPTRALIINRVHRDPCEPDDPLGANRQREDPFSIDCSAGVESGKRNMYRVSENKRYRPRKMITCQCYRYLEARSARARWEVQNATMGY